MAFDLDVFLPSIPSSLHRRWPQELGTHGLLCKLPPSFRIEKWQGGELAIKLEVAPNAFPAARRYGPRALVAGFGLEVYDAELTEDASVPRRFRSQLQQATTVFFLTTTSGRTVADLRLQCFAAATLAVLGDGLVFDPQQGRYFSGADAVQNATREADQFEAAIGEDQPEWSLPVFRSWRALEGGAAEPI